MTWLDDLSAGLEGQLTTADDPTWDGARAAWNLAVDQRPLAVVRPVSVRDVQRTLVAAARAGVRVAPQATGHNAAPLGDLAGTVLLRTDAMRAVHVDPVTRSARVQAGATWADVTGVAARHGLAALAGSAADVGVVGYTLGGGLSWLARSEGLAADHLLAAEVVTGEGTVLRVDATTHADLFASLRGGGGDAVVVTALEFRLFPVREVVAGALFHPIDAAAEVFAAWTRWTRSLPDEVTSTCRVLRFPPLPDLPPHLAGQHFTVVELCSTLDLAATEALVATLRAPEPLMDTITTTPVEQLHLLHMDPPGPVPAVGDGVVLDDLDDAGLAALLGQVGAGVDSPLLSVELRHLGGALTPGTPGPDGGRSGIEGTYLAFGVGITPDAAAAGAVRGALDRLTETLRPWTAPRRLPGFAETSEAPEVLYGDRVGRLRAVKRRYDPADTIRGNHPVLRAGRRQPVAPGGAPGEVVGVAGALAGASS